MFRFFHSFLSRILIFMMFALLNLWAEPMEPARSTLFILLDGLYPSEKGLSGDPCKSYELSEIWGESGFGKYLQEDITNSKALVYSRPFINPVESPIHNSFELGIKAPTDSSFQCSHSLLNIPKYDSLTKLYTYTKVDSSIKGHL